MRLLECARCGAKNRVGAIYVSKVAVCGRCGNSLPASLATKVLRTGLQNWAWLVLALVGAGAVLQSQLRPSAQSSGTDRRAQESSANAPPCSPERINSGIYRSYTYNNGVAPFQIITPSGQNYFVKIVDARSGAPVMAVFAQGGVPVQVEVPLGTYRVKYAHGETWCGEASLFGKETRFGEADKTFEFGFDGYQYSGYTIQLIPQRSGNLRTKAISAASF